MPRIAFCVSHVAFFYIFLSILHLTTVQGTRNRASPSRLVKLYKKMTESQCNRIKAIGFRGLLNIKYDTLPARLANWLTVDCFDAESSQLVLPGRGN